MTCTTLQRGLAIAILIGIWCSLMFAVGCRPARRIVVVPQPPAADHPQPPPATPNPPAAVPGDPLQQVGDFRSFWCQQDHHGHQERVFYIIGDQPEPRPDCLAQYRARGYTDVWLTVTRDQGLPGIQPFDYLADVPRYRALVSTFLATGLRVHPVIGCEDAEAMCRRHHGPFDQWLARVGTFIDGTDDLVTSYVFGVEIREWASWDQSLQMVALAGARSDRPIILHFGQEQWGPSSADPWAGGRQLAYWRAVQAQAGNNRVALGYQYRHAPTEDGGGGFLATVDDVREQTAELVVRLQPLGIPIIASEYAYRANEGDAMARGAVALAAGATGCMNGCPPR
jgi:hypothetical protein